MEKEYITKINGELYHYGIKGQKWGVRRYQYENGQLTAEGKNRYNISDSIKPIRGKHSIGYIDSVNRERKINSENLYKMDIAEAGRKHKIGSTAYTKAISEAQMAKAARDEENRQQHVKESRKNLKGASLLGIAATSIIGTKIATGFINKGGLKIDRVKSGKNAGRIKNVSVASIPMLMVGGLYAADTAIKSVSSIGNRYIQKIRQDKL